MGRVARWRVWVEVAGGSGLALEAEAVGGLRLRDGWGLERGSSVAELIDAVLDRGDLGLHELGHAGHVAHAVDHFGV